MVPGIYNYPNQYKGDTLDAMTFQVTDKDTGLPIDLSGATFKCQFRQPFKGKQVKEITGGSGITLTAPSIGKITIDAFIVTWDPGVYLYDIEATFVDGTVKTYIKGTINIISDNTI